MFPNIQKKQNLQRQQLTREQNESSLMKFIKSVSIRNKNTAKQYHLRLLLFEKFVEEKFNNKINIDELIQKIKSRQYDPYDILNDYCIFLQNNYNIASVTFRDKIITVKTFLEYNDIEISPKKFKLKVRFPKTVSRYKEAIDKTDIVKILNGCSDLRLKTYVMLLASTGLRGTEALSIRLKDLDFDSSSVHPSKVTIRGEYTKTKVDRYIFLTKEVKEQLKIWLDYKYRKRRICYYEENTNKDAEEERKQKKIITEYRTPEKNQNEFIFSLYKTDNHKPKPEILYGNLASIFSKTLDRIGMGSREDGNEIRRKITLHSFRRFVKTTISDLGYSDYSEWFIGHSGSTYWRKKDNEKAEIFQKIEPYLTFLNMQQLKRQGADLETKIEELQDINQVLREKDKMKEDVIANLSDKLIVLSERLDAIEKLNID
jgi:integrase